MEGSWVNYEISLWNITQLLILMFIKSFNDEIQCLQYNAWSENQDLKLHVKNDINKVKHTYT